MICGSYAPNIYYIQTSINSPEINSDLIITTISLSSQDISSDLYDYSSLSVTPGSWTTTTFILTPQSPNFIPISSLSFSSLASYHLSKIEKIGIIPNVYYETSVDLTWVISSSTTISYSLVDYDGDIKPSWVNLDVINSKITFTAPEQPIDKQYKLAIASTVTADNTVALKPVYLTVVGYVWNINNWSKWTSTNSNEWQTCKNEYTFYRNDKT